MCIAICMYCFFLHNDDLAILFHYRNETDLMFIPAPSNAQDFTGVLDGFRSVSLPSQFIFGNLSYSTAYVNNGKTITCVQSESFLLIIDQLQWTYQFWESIHLFYLKYIPNN